ncbi:protein of unknown function [Burkholderia multivorans]
MQDSCARDDFKTESLFDSFMFAVYQVNPPVSQVDADAACHRRSSTTGLERLPRGMPAFPAGASFLVNRLLSMDIIERF